ncbi:TPA: hypothetical protein U2N26_003389 [Acinetobacter nosocomialis]|uniref:hypothetical protein n=1 Tax=Acinetobacter nosocomialis TaxID=106654 RepID=UPI0018FFE315|nr:hypothetical protein [Acinetobacter nosocomialis]MBJ8461639.1 hypothetical protein [Acinetobacter nosocomialis]HEM7379988.1 hypothetical protein [Acinetobacter nosocomialis]HEM8429007.1 hypothetical protein [Acinetobacter nosocomialis]
MDKCREEFEQSPKTKELLSDSIYFDEKENRYKVNADGCLISVVFLNGRWEVWQEQQAKVEELQKQLSEYIFVAETIDEMYVKEAQKSDDLQKRVDQQGLIIAKAMSIASDLQKSWSMFEIGKKLEQALKGEGK